MNAVWLVILVIFALWGALTTIVLLADAMAKRRYDRMLEVRDWTEKVDAMRRLQDREGDA